MKRLILLTISTIITFSALAQTHLFVTKKLRDKTYSKSPAVLELNNQSMAPVKSISKEFLLYESTIGTTWYDLQSNASCQNRMFLYPDGFIGGTFAFGENYYSFFDKGTGYNKYEDGDWDIYPEQRIESDRTGWPSYSPWGTNGEIVVSHSSGTVPDGLVLSKRSTKGSGSWIELNYSGPDGHSLLWPRMTTSGPNHEIIHIIALTTPVANGGAIYEGQDGALVYSRSSDGGASWEIENEIIDGLSSAFYTGFEGDIYDIAYSSGNTLATLIGNDWTDLILLKSIDNGETWTKTIIWEHPYPLFDPNNMIVTDTFYCADGAHSVAIDNSGKVHIAFGLNRAYCDASTQFWFPLVDGVAYWNEDMPSFSNNLNALSPYGDTGSELIEDYNLIGWMQDIDGNGELDINEDVGIYYLGSSSMPQLVIDDQSQIFLVYSSITETYENGIQNYRHLWARGSNNNGISWGDFYDLTDHVVHIFDECVFPSCSPSSDGNLHLIYQIDMEPGMAVRGDMDPVHQNHINYLLIEKFEILSTAPGSLIGTVTDISTNLPVEGATISLSGSFYETTSGPDGSYEISNIPPGDYETKCSNMGYLNVITDIVITENILTVQDFELEEATSLAPPENLSASLFSENNVLLEWEIPISGTPTSYNIYRNDILIENSASTSINDLNLYPGTYIYFATAVYSIGESSPSNTTEITIGEYLLPPTYLITTVVDNDVILEWDPPMSGTVIGYNGYLNGNLYTNTSWTEIIFNNLGPGIYEFCVSSIYDEGESDVACADTVNFLFPPSNLELLVENGFIFFWQPPVEVVPNGYNFYHKLDNGNYYLAEFTTQDTIVFIPTIGTHYFFITAVYDDGESVGSNLVTMVFTNIDESKTTGITIYPNPASEAVNISAGFAIKSIRVYSPRGILVDSEELNTKLFRLNTSNYPPGLYYFRIETDRGTLSKKVIIK